MKSFEEHLRISTALNTLDYITTFIAFHIPTLPDQRPVRELNPLAAFLIKKNRWDILALFKIAVVAITHERLRSLSSSKNPQRARAALPAIRFTNYLMTAVVLNNSILIYRRLKTTRA